MKSLLSDDEEVGNNALGDIKVNQKFAKKYEEKKRNEELSILKDKYGDVSDKMIERLEKGKHVHRGKTSKEAYDDDEDSETDTDEDEFGEELTPEVDAQILRTIAAIRSKTKEAVDPNVKFFSDEKLEKLKADAPKSLSTTAEAPKPYSIKDYHRETLLSGNIPGNLPQTAKVLTHAEEQEQIKNEFKRAAFVKDESTDSEDDKEKDDILQLRVKSKEEEEDEEKQYKNWLVESIKQDGAAQASFKDWIDYHETGGANKKELDPNDKFLMEFVFNRGWIDKEELSKSKLPSYEEIIDEDEEEVEKAEEFETQYNFRFEQMEAEQPGSSYHSNLYGIKSHARDVEDTARRKVSKRAEERQKKKERKELEKQQKLEELKRLKNLKKSEIVKKLKKVQEISGIEDDERLQELLDGVDLDGDFDPAVWDQKMQETFDDGYYDQTKGDKRKPKFEDDDEYLKVSEEMAGDQEVAKLPASLLKGKKVNFSEYEFGRVEGDEEEDDIMMDADYMPGGELYEQDENEGEGGPQDNIKELSSILEEYYQLDYEDMIGDLPTRFKYRKVEDDSFGLNADEILKAKDKDLNEFLSLKKLAPYRTEPKHQEWFKKWKKGGQKRRKELRDKLKEMPDDDDVSGKGKKEKKRKRQKNSLEENNTQQVVSKDLNENDDEEKKSGKKRKRKRGKEAIELDKTRMAAYSTKKSKG